MRVRPFKVNNVKNSSDYISTLKFKDYLCCATGPTSATGYTLSLFQFQGFPKNTADTTTISVSSGADLSDEKKYYLE